MGGQPPNGVLIAAYAVEHTLAKEITAQPKEVVTLEGRRQPLNCLVDYVSFSAHVAPKHIILVHGQKDEMARLVSLDASIQEHARKQASNHYHATQFTRIQIVFC